MIYFCDQERRAVLRGQNKLNGIDYLEVEDDPAKAYDRRQRRLFVHFLNERGLAKLTPDHVVIEGGERIRTVSVVAVRPPDSPPEQTNVRVVEVAKPGDFSTYTLRLVRSASEEVAEPPEDFDPVLSEVPFTFKAGCRRDFDCKARLPDSGPAEEGPDINYLARDYASFRQSLLDRMAVVMPQWGQRHPADVGVALVELLAYVGDYLSYRQDAIATEAYLDTARRRVSVRRHARLVDYHLHDWCNARVWVRLQVKPAGDGWELKTNAAGPPVQFLTQVRGMSAALAPGSTAYTRALESGAVVFEMMPHQKITLFAEHNEMPFYTWGSRQCSLARGAVSATLRGEFRNLRAGDVLILAEVRNPRTGTEADADASRRHAVRLAQVTPSCDRLGGGVPITEIEWRPEDKLPFALCLASYNGDEYLSDLSVAWGNIVLADHGRTLSGTASQSLLEPDTVLPSSVAQAASCPSQGKFCQPAAGVVPLPRFRPMLRQAPLTQAAPWNPEDSPASSAMEWSLHEVMPCLWVSDLAGDGDGTPVPWEVKRDLLASGPDQREFVVETESDGTARLRFGDGKFGLSPAPGTRFRAVCRVGNGTAGNIGAEALRHIVAAGCDDTLIAGVSNPLSAYGGIEPQPLEQCRQQAPAAFRVQERAVTVQDYADLVQRGTFDVQGAAATRRWTGGWYTAFVTVDRQEGREVDESFAEALQGYLEQYRMADEDVQVDAPRFVPLEVEMVVCVAPDFFCSDVRAALLEVFSNGVRPTTSAASSTRTTSLSGRRSF